MHDTPDAQKRTGALTELWGWPGELFFTKNTGDLLVLTGPLQVSGQETWNLTVGTVEV